MWKKPLDAVSPPTSTRPAPGASHRPQSRIGPGVVLKGNIHGREDLLVQGRIDGRVELEEHSVAIEESAHVEGDISARNIRIAGEVRGNLTAQEEVVLLKTARLEGNIAAKRVSIDAGAHFKGSIDMEVGTAAAPLDRPSTRQTTEPRNAVVPEPIASAHRLDVG